MHGQVKVEAGQRLCHGIDIFAALDSASLGRDVLGLGSWLLRAVVLVEVGVVVEVILALALALGWVSSLSLVSNDRRRKRAPLEDGDG